MNNVIHFYNECAVCLVCWLMQLFNQPVMWQQHNILKHAGTGQEPQPHIYIKYQKWENSETADLLAFSCPMVSDQCEKQKAGQVQ